MAEEHDHGNGNGDAHDTDPAPSPPRPRRLPTLLDLDARLTTITDAVLDTNERLGHMMRELALTRNDVREIRCEVNELRSDERRIRERLDSVPDLVRDVAEDTGRHAVTELEKRLAVEQLGETKQALARRSDRIWQAAVVALGVLLTAAVSAIGYLLTHAH